MTKISEEDLLRLRALREEYREAQLRAAVMTADANVKVTQFNLALAEVHQKYRIPPDEPIDIDSQAQGR